MKSWRNGTPMSRPRWSGLPRTMRPIYARVAKDNVGSRRVLEKCGFQVIGESTGYANARGEEVEELLLELQADEKDRDR